MKKKCKCDKLEAGDVIITDRKGNCEVCCKNWRPNSVDNIFFNQQKGLMEMSMKPIITPSKLLKNEILQGDCLEVMKDIPDGSIDMILTDPPYGMDLTPQRTGGKYKGVKIHNDDNLDWSDNFFEQCFRVLKKDCIMYSFCSYHSVGTFIDSAKKSGFIVKNLLVWDKMWFGMGNNWRPNFELILVLGNGRFVTKSNNKSNILSYRRISPQKSKHPTEKVIPLLEELIVEPDYNPQLILDPFAGSGTTGVACKNLNRNYILIEKEPEYIDIIKKRLYVENSDCKTP